MKNILFCASLIWFFSACNSNTPAPTAESEVASTHAPTAPSTSVTLTDAQLKHANLTTTQPEETSVATRLKVNGKIDLPPQKAISVSAPLGGYLRHTNLIPGMSVSKGEVIATLEDPNYVQLQQDYLIAQSKWQYAELEYTRQADLNQSQAASNKVMQQAKAEVDLQRINMRALAEKLTLINIDPNALTAENITKIISIRSRINGWVNKVNVNIGKYINPNEAMFELIDPTDIHLQLKVFEKDIPRLKIGQKVIAFHNSAPADLQECQIILIGKEITADGTIDVHCHFSKPNKNILPGMYMNAEIIANPYKTYTIPKESVVAYEGKQYIFVKGENNQFQMEEISIGAESGDRIVLAQPEKWQGKTIVANGAYTLLMSLKNVEE